MVDCGGICIGLSGILIQRCAVLALKRAITVLSILVILAAWPGVCQAVSIAQEIKIGQETSKLILKEMPLSEEQSYQDGITALGSKLTPFVSRPEIPYNFAVVTDSRNTINAFALPGGYIYFTEHMWRILTPDERAAVLAHEITHCDLRHGIDANIKQQQRMLWTLPLIVLGGAAGADAWVWGNMIVNARYSRKMEREADENGIRLATKAGFNPAGAVTSMKKLLSIENDQNRYEVSAIFSGHPETQKRIDYLTQAAIELGAEESMLDLPMVDDPARLGNVTKKAADMQIVYAKTSQSLEFGAKVIIKKMLWDENNQALEPKVIAEATVLTPGRFPTLALTEDKDSSTWGVMPGDGVYATAEEPDSGAADDSVTAHE